MYVLEMNLTVKADKKENDAEKQTPVLLFFFNIITITTAPMIMTTIVTGITITTSGTLKADCGLEIVTGEVIMLPSITM